MTSVILGYHRENPLIPDELNSLKYMMIAIEFIMIAHFAKEGYDDIASSNVAMVQYIDAVWGVFNESDLKVS